MPQKHCASAVRYSPSVIGDTFTRARTVRLCAVFEPIQVGLLAAANSSAVRSFRAWRPTQHVPLASKRLDQRCFTGLIYLSSKQANESSVSSARHSALLSPYLLSQRINANRRSGMQG
jgi:hypothetical protein